MAAPGRRISRTKVLVPLDSIAPFPSTPMTTGTIVRTLGFPRADHNSMQVRVDSGQEGQVRVRKDGPSATAATSPSRNWLPVAGAVFMAGWGAIQFAPLGVYYRLHEHWNDLVVAMMFT